MRAACEACSAPQPPDWRPGHFCTSCGSPTRRETRCAWCVRWTPVGAHCRHCGAGLVDDELFAAARMVRDAGTDRFSIARVLGELGSDRIADLTRVFQRHAAVLAAHVDALAMVEEVLVVRGLAATLEDEQLPLLPWPDDVLARYEAALPRDLGRSRPLEDVRRIGDGTSFELVRQAAAVARLALDDWGAAAGVIDVLHGAVAARLRSDAVLALTGWRARTMISRVDLVWPTEAIDAALRAAVDARPSDERVAALVAVRRSGLAREPDREALADLVRRGDLDDESRFDVALQLGATDVLRGALAAEPLDPVARIAAARVLLRAGQLDGIDAALRDGPDAVVEAVVGELDRLRAVVPVLEPALVDVVVTTTDARLAHRATRVAARALTSAGSRAIARRWLDDASVVQALLQGSGVAAESVVELADLLLETGRFRSGQFGVSTVAEDGRLDDRWVPTRFGRATPAQQAEMMRVAEVQLGARADESLHRFLLEVVLGDVASEVRVQALWAVRRWYRSGGDMRGEGPLALAPDALAAVGWTVADAATGLARLLRDDAALRDVGMFEWVAALLRSADDAFVADTVARGHHPAGGGGRPGAALDGFVDGFVGALSALAASDHWSPLVAEARRLLDRLSA